MKNLKYYIKRAHKEHWAVGHFNFSDFNQVKGIVQAAQVLKAPIILATSEGEGKFFGFQEAVALRNVLRKKTGLPIFLNSDHGKSFEYLKQAILAGYDMVHFDGSKLPLEENIKISKKVAALARQKGVVIEGEVGRFGTDSSRLYTEHFEIKEENLTSVMDAETYMKKTGMDLLAVSIGTFHGVEASGPSPHLRLDRLREISERIKTPLVLHGGSGTPEADLKESIRLGISKININTDTRLAFSNTLRKMLEINKDEITPYHYMQEPIAAVQRVIQEKITLFGSAGKA